jgi:hypothetical protein
MAKEKAARYSRSRQIENKGGDEGATLSWTNLWGLSLRFIHAYSRNDKHALPGTATHYSSQSCSLSWERRLEYLCCPKSKTQRHALFLTLWKKPLKSNVT